MDQVLAKYAEFRTVFHAHDAFTNSAIPLDTYHITVSIGMWAAVSFVLSVLADLLFIRHVTRDASHRWFLIHVIFNSTVVAGCLRSSIDTLVDPMNSWSVGYDPMGLITTATISGFHAYHAVMYTITREDVVHHVVNTGVVALIGCYFPWGKMLCLSNLIMCGLPGGLDYAMLVLVKYDLITKDTRKFIARGLNLLIRWPFEFLCLYLFAVNLIHGKVHGSTFEIAVMASGGLAHGFNALYYCDQVVGAYHVGAAAASPSSSAGKKGKKDN